MIEEFYGAKKKSIWDVNVDIVISNFIETKNSSKYLIGYINEVVRPLVLILTKMSAYVKTFKDKNNKLMLLCVNDDIKEKYKTIWTMIEELKNNWIECFTSLC